MSYTLSCFSACGNINIYILQINEQAPRIISCEDVHLIIINILFP